MIIYNDSMHRCTIYFMYFIYIYIVLQEEATTVSASVKKITNDNAQVEKEVDILAESLTQQPNLSQG